MTKDADDASFQDSLIVPFYVGNGRIRIHVGGRRDALREFAVAASSLQYGANDEASLLDAVTSLAGRLGLTIADVLDMGPPVRPTFDIVDLVYSASRRPTAEQAWARIKAVLTSASDDELEALADPEQLSRVRTLVNSVLDDLDEQRPAAEAELRAELSEQYCYLLLA